ncbi:glycoside hydrolase family 97 protein [Chitinophaga cymbidii]|uniref:Alpha-glucosidase n=1 Tax=Chitinophaga cymbidii TaxID=1096750 RepID=A0A512RQP8_9BACT|nr:glycoside hydrolase family 97 protein [Chitinophaga cymbidii]GEP98031.1 alpha-glucosidase [Chitinophaga cymbidii]
MSHKIVPVIFLFLLSACAQNNLHFSDPSGKISAQLHVTDGKLLWSATAGEKMFVEPSAAGIQLSDVALGEDVRGITVSRETITGESRVYDVTVKGEQYTFGMEFRLFPDGCAFRYKLPGEGVTHVRKEFTSFTIPASSRVWFFERNSAWKLKSYAGWWTHTVVDSLPVISSSGPVQGKPLVIQLDDKSYTVITEAALYDYSGMRLEATGGRKVQVNFTEGDKGFDVQGGQYTPWRVVMYAKDLNSLVNNQMIVALNPRPDSALYSDVSYIQPGKAVWSWITRKENYMQPEEEKRFIDAASALKFEYTLLDEGWETVWPDKWAQLKDICGYAAARHVKVWVWRDSKRLREPAQRDAFLDSLVLCGVAGVKTDFMNSEAKDLVDFETGFLKATAAHRLMVNFHGCHAPTGESVTYPNEMTREGIRGLELNNMNEPIPAWHNAALPFTRFLCGHGDYTPGFFSNKGPTTYTHQLALMYLFNSPFQCMAENPVTILQDSLCAPVIPLLQTLPVTWDETRVLEGSEIGKLAALAKRKGNEWYVAVINGTEQAQEFVLRPSFLGGKDHTALVVSDGEGFVLEEKSMKATDTEKFVIPATGGLVIRFM